MSQEPVWLEMLKFTAALFGAALALWLLSLIVGWLTVTICCYQ